MKQEQLLEAIGQIDDELLAEPVRRKPKLLRRTLLAAALMAALALTASALSSTLFKSGSNTMDNIITGLGRFAYDEGYIYYGSVGTIYKLELETGSAEKIPLSDSQADPKYLTVAQNGLGYVTGFDRFEIISPEGSTQQVLIEEDTAARLFVDGNMLYTENGVNLQRINTETGEKEVLATGTHGYYVDDSYIYALTEGNLFLRSGKDSIAFEEIPLSFHPAGILAAGEDLYFSVYQGDGHYQVIHYRDGIETRLPIFAYFMQMLDGKLLYLDCIEKNVLKSYHLTTGETEVIAGNVFEFSVLENRYLCIDFFNDSCLVLDFQTGTEFTFGK